MESIQSATDCASDLNFLTERVRTIKEQQALNRIATSVYEFLDVEGQTIFKKLCKCSIQLRKRVNHGN